MNTRLFLIALSTLAAACSPSLTDSEESSALSDEAALTATAPELLRRGSTGIESSGLPLVVGLPAGEGGAKVRELVFVDTSVPAGPDADGRPRFPEIRYEKRVLAWSDDGVTVSTPAEGVASGAMLVSATEGVVREAVLASANRELDKLWETHPEGRFTVKMFPGSSSNVARTANGYTVTMSSDGSISAYDGKGHSYDAEADLATLEELTVTSGGEESVSQCRYRLHLKEAAVLSQIANAAVFHVERTLVERTGDIPCVQSEDRYVIGLPTY